MSDAQTTATTAPAAAQEGAAGEVLLEVRDGLGRITLNRPRALNALTQDMVRAIDAALTDWAADPAVRGVLIRGAGEKGLCAGGDVVSLRSSLLAGRFAEAEEFFRDEYAMNERIAAYPKPYVAFMDGVVLGGGMGVSAHGSHRVATERTRAGMPETAIGFTPDVGGSFHLARAPFQAGRHLAATSAHASGSDAVALGLADVFVESARLDELEQALAAAHPPEVGPVSGLLLREDLDARPHLLVGAASNAVRTDRIPVVTRSSTRRRAAALLGETPVPENRPRRTAAVLTDGPDPAAAPRPDASVPPAAQSGTAAAAGSSSAATPAATAADHPSDEAAEPMTTAPTPAPATAGPAGGPEDGAARRRRGKDDRPVQYRRGWFIPVFTTLLALTLAAVAVWGYLWTQTQYYVGANDGRIAVFKGVSQRLGPLELSHVDRQTDLPVDALPAYARDRVNAGMPARDVDHAEQIVAELRDSLHPNAPAPAGEPSERARPSTTPSSSSARPSDASGSAAPTSPASSPSATGGEAP